MLLAPIPPNTLLVPTPGTARRVSWCFGGGRGTAKRWAAEIAHGRFQLAHFHEIISRGRVK